MKLLRKLICSIIGHNYLPFNHKEGQPALKCMKCGYSTTLEDFIDND